MDIIMEGLKPFQYSYCYYNNNETKVKLGAVVYDPETHEYLFRKMEARVNSSEFADNTHRVVVEDFLADFPSLELVYAPVPGSPLDKYESWLEAVCNELKGIVRFTRVGYGISVSLEEALGILVSEGYDQE